MIQRWEASSPPPPLSGAYLRLLVRGLTTADLRQDILRTPVLRPTSDLMETRPTPPTDIVTETAEIGEIETVGGTMSVAVIMIETEDVVVAEVEIEDVAEAVIGGGTEVVTETVTGMSAFY